MDCASPICSLRLYVRKFVGVCWRVTSSWSHHRRGPPRHTDGHCRSFTVWAPTTAAPISCVTVMTWVPPVDDNVCLLVGKIIVRWAFLEQQVNDVIERMHRSAAEPSLPERWRKQFRREQRIKLFADHAKRCFGAFPKIENQLCAVRADMEAIMVDRDILAHGDIHLLWPSARLQAIGTKNKQEFEQIYDPAALQSIIDAITLLLQRIQGLADETERDRQSDWSPEELSALREFLAPIKRKRPSIRSAHT